MPSTLSTAPSNLPPPDALISTTQALAYWDSVPASVDGMLGGYPQISRIDLQGSSNFLAKLRKSKSTGKLNRVVDCGAGIGRITKGLLLHVAETVDVVEPVVKFTDALRAEQKEEDKTTIESSNGIGVIGQVFNVGLQDWNPVLAGSSGYNLIWNQWCVGQLTDVQLVEYLQRCGRAVVDGGWIVVKENVSTDLRGDDIYDETDSSVTRSDEHFREIFRIAHLKIVATEVQKGFPKSLGLYPVRSYALQPVR